MSETAVSPATTYTLEWLALSLTPGLGPTKARRLVEHFGSSEAVFRASLTELESTGIQRSRPSPWRQESRWNWLARN